MYNHFSHPIQITSTSMVAYISIAADYAFTEFHSGQILSPSVRTNILDEVTQNPSYARSKYPTQLAKMSSDQIFDLRADISTLWWGHMKPVVRAIEASHVFAKISSDESLDLTAYVFLDEFGPNPRPQSWHFYILMRPHKTRSTRDRNIRSRLQIWVSTKSSIPQLRMYNNSITLDP